MFAGVQIKNLP